MTIMKKLSEEPSNDILIRHPFWHNKGMDPEELVLFIYEVLDELPRELRGKLDNVEFVVENFPSAEVKRKVGKKTILGLYRGIPLNRRNANYNLVLPDQIIIYAGNIERVLTDPRTWKETVRKVVLHEIGHYFGFGEEELQELLG